MHAHSCMHKHTPLTCIHVPAPNAHVQQCINSPFAYTPTFATERRRATGKPETHTNGTLPTAHRQSCGKSTTYVAKNREE